MPRIYSNYSQAEFQLVQAQCRQVGLTPSAYQKYHTLLSLPASPPAGGAQPGAANLPALLQLLMYNLNRWPAGVPFIVSSLLPDQWPALSKPIKNTLSQALRRTVAGDPARYKKLGVLPGKINQYCKL